MTEIGLAQRRLLDDEPSSGPQLQSTAALYSTESIQSAPFPTIPSSHSCQFGQAESTSFPYPGAPNGAYADTDQSLLPTRQGIYDLTPPDTTNSMAPPQKSVPQQSSESCMEQENAQSDPPQEYLQPKPQQVDPSSPHDTEPLSSIITLRYSGIKADTAGTSLVSPQHSQSSAHDELALPAVVPTIDAPTAKKKRGRPKKQSVPDSDEDDELANSRDHEFRNPSANGAIDPSNTEEITENNTPASSGTPDETDEGKIEPAPKATKANPQDPKKKKAKKAKTSSAPDPGADDDDVIWLDTKPRDMHSSSEKATPQTETPSTRDRESESLMPENAPGTSKASTPVEEKKLAPSKPEKLAPKKRGRKRKQPIESKTPEADTPDPSKLPETETPAAKLAVVVDNSPRSVPTNVCDETSMPAMQEQEHEQNAESVTDAPAIPPATGTDATTSETLPQTPSKSDAKSVNTPLNAGKGPDKHSPISARSAVPYRVGLSKRARIAPLLKMVRK
jgi:hypothetical protein